MRYNVDLKLVYRFTNPRDSGLYLGGGTPFPPPQNKESPDHEYSAVSKPSLYVGLGTSQGPYKSKSDIILRGIPARVWSHRHSCFKNHLPRNLFYSRIGGDVPQAVEWKVLLELPVSQKDYDDESLRMLATLVALGEELFSNLQY